MGGFCNICNHKKRLEIDRELIQGIALSILARKYDVSRDSLDWHKKNHLSHQIAVAYQKRDAQNAVDLLSKIDGILTNARNIFQRNYDKGRDGLAIKALSEQRNTLQLLAQISVALHQARLAELEQTRLENGEVEKEQEQDWQESLKVLTNAELKMLRALSHKLETQDSRLIIIPNDEALDFMPDIDYTEQDYQSDQKQANSPKETTNFDIVEPEPESEPRRKRRTRFPNRVE